MILHVSYRETIVRDRTVRIETLPHESPDHTIARAIALAGLVIHQQDTRSLTVHEPVQAPPASLSIPTMSKEAPPDEPGLQL